MKPEVLPSYWFERAAEARNTAGYMTDPTARDTMYRLADAYERMAMQAAAREQRRKQA